MNKKFHNFTKSIPFFIILISLVGTKNAISQNFTYKLGSEKELSSCNFFCGSCNERVYNSIGQYEDFEENWLEVETLTPIQVYINNNFFHEYGIITKKRSCLSKRNISYSTNIVYFRYRDGYTTDFKNTFASSESAIDKIREDALNHFNAGLKVKSNADIAKESKSSPSTVSFSIVESNIDSSEIVDFHWYTIENRRMIKTSDLKSFSTEGGKYYNNKIEYIPAKKCYKITHFGDSPLVRYFSFVKKGERYFMLNYDENGTLTTHELLKYYDKKKQLYLPVALQVQQTTKVFNQVISCDYCYWGNKKYTVGDTVVVDKVMVWNNGKKEPILTPIVFKCENINDILQWSSSLTEPFCKIAESVCVGCYVDSYFHDSGTFSLGAYAPYSSEICDVKINETIPKVTAGFKKLEKIRKPSIYKTVQGETQTEQSAQEANLQNTTEPENKNAEHQKPPQNNSLKPIPNKLENGDFTEGIGWKVEKGEVEFINGIANLIPAKNKEKMSLESSKFQISNYAQNLIIKVDKSEIGKGDLEIFVVIDDLEESIHVDKIDNSLNKTVKILKNVDKTLESGKIPEKKTKRTFDKINIDISKYRGNVVSIKFLYESRGVVKAKLYLDEVSVR